MSLTWRPATTDVNFRVTPDPQFGGRGLRAPQQADSCGLRVSRCPVAEPSLFAPVEAIRVGEPVADFWFLVCAHLPGCAGVLPCAPGFCFRCLLVLRLSLPCFNYKRGTRRQTALCSIRCHSSSVTGITERRPIRTRGNSANVLSALMTARVTLTGRVRGIDIGLARDFRCSDDRLDVSRCIKKDPIAFVHRTNVFLSKRISHTRPGGAAIAHEVVKAVVSGFFFDQPIHGRLL